MTYCAQLPSSAMSLRTKLLDGADTGGAVARQSYAMAVINFSKAFMGASSFELPWAFAQAGLVGGVVGTLAFAVLSNVCFSMLVQVSHLCSTPEHKNPTYPQIGRMCFGVAGETLVWFGMVAMTIGVCGSYLIFVGQTMAELVDQFLFGDGTPPSENPPYTTACTVLAALPAAALSSIRTTRALSYASAIGLLATFVACAVVAYDALTRPDATFDLGRVLAREPAVRWPTYPLFLGNAGYLFLISTAVLPLEQSMDPEHRPHFSSAFSVAQVIASVPNVCFAVVTAVAYGSTPEGVQPNVMANLTPGTLSTLVDLAMAINQLFTFAIFMLSMAESLELWLFVARGAGPSVELGRNIVRFGLTAAAAGIAICIPNFALLTGLTGAFGNNLLAFVFVPVFFVARRRALGRAGVHGPLSLTEWGTCGILLTFGKTLLVLSTASTVARALE